MAVPLIITALGQLALNPSIRTAVINAALPKDGRKALSTEAQQGVVEVMAKLATDPAFINATNAEKPVQSRTTIGGAQSFLGGVAFLLPIVLAQLGVNVNEAYLIQLFGALMAVWGGLYTVWGRWAPNLKPLFETKWGKVMGALGLGSILAALVLVIIMVLR
jgi:hypothetical protein